MQPLVDKIAFTIFGIDIAWYAILIASGMMLGIILAERDAKRRGLNPEKIMDILIVALPMAIVGARIYYVAFEWDYYKDNLIKILNIREGGLAIYGGIIAAYLTGYIMAKKSKLNFMELADITAPSLALGQAIGRWGNFINMEAHGYETNLPWAVIIDGVGYHPTFLYESLGDFVIFIFLFYFARKKQKYKGQIIALYMILYGILRFFVEGLRTDSLYFMGMRISQIVSLVGILIGLYIFATRKEKINFKNNKKNNSK